MMTINNQPVATVNAIHDSKAQIFLDEYFDFSKKIPHEIKEKSVKKADY